MKKIMYSAYVVFFELPIVLMFLAGITGVSNMIANYERNQICKLAQQRNEAIAMKVMPEQIEEKGVSENEKTNIDMGHSSVHSANRLLAYLRNRSIEMDRRTGNIAVHQITGLI